MLSAFVLLSQAFTFPSPVRDVATNAFAPGYTLQYPLLYILFAPFFMLAESMTLIGAWGSYALIAYIVVLAILTRSWKWGPLLFLSFSLLVAWGALVPKPTARLVASNPDTILVDFHSHSNRSHDGRPSFTPEANRSWHRAQGYHAGFITDHNRIESSKEAKLASRADWPTYGYSSLEGEEISLKKTHLVVLGTPDRIDNQPYDSDWTKIPVFIADMHKQGKLVIASLPEYWLYHWGEGIDYLIHWGIDGFEVVNSAPKALDFPILKRLHILNLCSSKNIFITGISDNHGYGYATAAWNAVYLPGWQSMDPDTLERAILNKLRTERFRSVSVLERIRYCAAAKIDAIIAPFASMIILWRSLTPILALSWLVWIWLGLFLYSLASRKWNPNGEL